MPVYEYTALDTRGKKHKGVLDADSRVAARQKIRQDGTYPVEIKDSVNEGNSLTSSLSEHPRLFSKIYVNMVQAGEASGSLDVVLERLAEVGDSSRSVYVNGNCFSS